MKNDTNKFRLFIENFLVYGLGGIISKLVPLIMLPIITRIIPTTEYFGLSDLSNTAISFGSALAVIGMYDAMYRLFFEKDDDEYKKTICSTTIIFTSIMSVFVTTLMIVFRGGIARYFFGNLKYTYLVYITAVATLVTATNSIVAAPTRMQNKRKVFLVTNTISPLLSYSIAVPLIMCGYYVIALPLSALIAGFTMETIFWLLNNKWFKLKLFNKSILKQLLIIAIPLFPNFLIYWIFNSSDKLMITNIINVGASGVYSVGSKIGHCSQLIYTAFAGGWQYFAFSTMKEKNQVDSNSRIFEYLGVISFVATMYICSFSYLLFRIIFPIKYTAGYIVSPYLFLAPLLQMLFQVACNQFLVIKKTWPNMFILLSGAVINVFLNLLLIPIMGIEGAAIATLIGYLCSDVICCIVLIKMKLMNISKRFLISVLLVFLYFIVWRILLDKNTIVSFLLAFLVTLINIYLYKNEIAFVLKKIKK